MHFLPSIFCQPLREDWCAAVDWLTPAAQWWLHRVSDATPYTTADESDLILRGYVAFLDPPKNTAREALRALQTHGISVKVVRGDNELVAKKICKEVGLSTEFTLRVSNLEAMTDDQLAMSPIQIPANNLLYNISQTAIPVDIHIIRTNTMPFLQSLPSWSLLAMSTLIMGVGIAIPLSPLGDDLGFVHVPRLYWLLLTISMMCYAVLTQTVNVWLLKKCWI